MGLNVVFDNLYLDRCLRSGWYLDIIMLLLLEVTSLMFRSDSTVFGLPGSWAWWWMIWCHLIFLIYHIFDVILGHILFRVRSKIFTELYACPHLRDVCWDDWLVRYFMMIPQWSLCGAIHPGPHFSTFDCCHVSYSQRRSLDAWSWFGSRRSHVWW